MTESFDGCLLNSLAYDSINSQNFKMITNYSKGSKRISSISDSKI
jgi:hypothetical protein